MHASLLLTLLLVHHVVLRGFSDAVYTLLRHEWQKRLGPVYARVQRVCRVVFVAKGQLLEGRSEPLAL